MARRTRNISLTLAAKPEILIYGSYPVIIGIQFQSDTARDGLTWQMTELDTATLKVLTEFFPIGKKLRYCPDAQLDVVFDTIIVAYCVNDRCLYFRDAIAADSNGNPSVFAIGEGKTALPAHKIQQLQLLVPDTSDLEGTLDYDRRAIIGRSRQFLVGNAITLLSNAGARGVATLRTLVAEQRTMQEGPYANGKMVLLSPQLDSFRIADQLHKSRGKTHVPVALYFKKGEPPYSCALNDFSESSVGLHANENQPPMPPLEQDDAVTLVINLGDAAKTYTIKGRVLRRSADACVVRLEELFKDHEFSRLNLLDALELKTGLLNYGN